MPSNIVEEFYSNYNELLKRLEAHDELSLKIWVHHNFNKIFVVVIASYFENEITKLITEFAKTKSDNDSLIVSFIKNAAIERRYHTYFNWKENTATSFFSLFGEDFKKKAVEDVRNDDDLKGGIESFLKIGRTRNLVHSNLFETDSTKTAEDFYALYKKALVFLEYIRKELS